MLTKTLIDKFYEDVEALGLKFPVAAICKATKFGKGQVSDYLKKNKQPSQNFLNAFYKAFESSINVPRATNGAGKPQEPQIADKSELLDIMRERIRDLKEERDKLERDKERLWQTVETSLTGLTIGQKSILAHVAVILEKDDERDSAGNKRKEQALKDETGKRIVDKISGVSQMDNSRSG